MQIGTQSAKTRCDVMQSWLNAHRSHGCKVTDGGEFEWVAGNLGRLQYKVTLGYQTDRAMGWTIAATAAGTTFTNDRTGHGMAVSVESVSPF